MLTHSLAQEVAEETAAVTGLGILITDQAGIVIGSSDPKRVGTFHEASVDVVRTREPATHTAKQASALRGVRPGLTAPIVVDGQAVGTVGITGSPARVRRFGPVVRRHTEILLEESAALQTRLLRERAIEDLLHDIASYNPELVEPELVVSRAAELGYDLRVRRNVAVLEISLGDGEPNAPAHNVSLLRSELVRTIREQFAEAQTVVASLGSGTFAVLHRLPAGTSPAADADAATAAICQRAVAAISARHHLATRAGIAGPATTPAQLHDAYLDASDALRLGATLHPQDTVLTIAGLRKHQLIGAAGPRTRQRLRDVELPQLRSSPEWPALRQTMVAWCESGFNLVRAAARLHLHRNTLIYRLAKIEQLTGRNLRDHPASLTLYLACLADELDTSQHVAPSRQLDMAPHAAEPS
jgi:carbohydrate diacid regulator